jgi:PhnB protein
VPTIQLNPYLQFRDQARDAMAFYERVLGGELTMQTYAEGGMSGDPSNDERIMHAQLVSPHGLVLMASDVPDGVPYEQGSSVWLSLGGDDPALEGLFEGLSEGGTVTEPLREAPWGDRFGTVVDRFGVGWMVNIGSAPG